MFIEIIAETVVTYYTILPMLPPNQNLMNTMLPIKNKRLHFPDSLAAWDGRVTEFWPMRYKGL